MIFLLFGFIFLIFFLVSIPRSQSEHRLIEYEKQKRKYNKKHKKIVDDTTKSEEDEEVQETNEEIMKNAEDIEVTVLEDHNDGKFS
jgi:uncharacterized membrane protein